MIPQASMRALPLVRSLKAGPSAQILLLLLANPQRPFGTGELCQALSWSDKPITQALRCLQEQGLVQRVGHYRGWLIACPFPRTPRTSGLGADTILQDVWPADSPAGASPRGPAGGDRGPGMERDPEKDRLEPEPVRFAAELDPDRLPREPRRVEPNEILPGSGMAGPWCLLSPGYPPPAGADEVQARLRLRVETEKVRLEREQVRLETEKVRLERERRRRVTPVAPSSGAPQRSEAGTAAPGAPGDTENVRFEPDERTAEPEPGRREPESVRLACGPEPAPSSHRIRSSRCRSSDLDPGSGSTTTTTTTTTRAAAPAKTSAGRQGTGGPAGWDPLHSLLVKRCGSPPGMAREAVAAMAATGDDLDTCRRHALTWLSYYHSERGQGIKAPGVFIAKRLAEGVLCPEDYQPDYDSDLGREIDALAGITPGMRLSMKYGTFPRCSMSPCHCPIEEEDEEEWDEP